MTLITVMAIQTRTTKTDMKAQSTAVIPVKTRKRRRTEALTGAERLKRHQRKRAGVVRRDEITPSQRTTITPLTYVKVIPADLKKCSFLKTCRDLSKSPDDTTPGYFPGLQPLTVAACNLKGHASFTRSLSVLIAGLMSTNTRNISFGDQWEGAENAQIVTYQSYEALTEETKFKGYHQDEESTTPNKCQLYALTLVLKSKHSRFELSNALDLGALTNGQCQIISYEGKAGQLLIFPGKYVHRGLIYKKGGYRQIYTNCFRVNDNAAAKEHRERLFKQKK
jgi:hypothetical protein